MKSWKSILVTVAVVCLASSAFAQFHGPGIGVFFDEDATQSVVNLEGGITQYHTAYVYAVNADQWVGGMAFKLELDERIHIMAVEYPNAIKLGEPDMGVSIGFSDCRCGYLGMNVLGAVLTLWTGNELITNGSIRVVANPDEGGILLSDCEGALSSVSGWTSFLSVTVDDDATSWGEIKDLYR